MPQVCSAVPMLPSRWRKVFLSSQNHAVVASIILASLLDYYSVLHRFRSQLHHYRATVPRSLGHSTRGRSTVLRVVVHWTSNLLVRRTGREWAIVVSPRLHEWTGVIVTDDLEVIKRCCCGRCVKSEVKSITRAVGSVDNIFGVVRSVDYRNACHSDRRRHGSKYLRHQTVRDNSSHSADVRQPWHKFLPVLCHRGPFRRELVNMLKTMCAAKCVTAKTTAAAAVERRRLFATRIETAAAASADATAVIEA